MTDDFVKRLRSSQNIRQIAAADEITRLQEENNNLRESVNYFQAKTWKLNEENEKLRIEVMSDYNEGWEEGLSAMKEENEKLRHALEGMIDLAEAANMMDDSAYDTARKILEE